MKKIINKKYINIENILCLAIILCPIFDIVSFLYRGAFNSTHSPSTILRPIIPIIVSVYIFFKNDRKFKLYTIGIGCLYFLYGVIHLLVFNSAVTGSSYSTVFHEAQYIINYTFMILNLFIYIYVFRDSENNGKLYNSILIASTIYIVSIYISIITKTSSNTYTAEKMGYKGWFESGNSIGAILILSLFIIIKFLKEEKYKKLMILVILLEGIFLTMLLGTRVGLLGFISVIIVYGVTQIVISLIQNTRVNKKTIVGCIAAVSVILLLVIAVGSTTIQRRKHLQEIEGNIIDKTNNQESHITGSLLEIKEKIDNNSLEGDYMNEFQKESVIDLYNICNKLKIKNNDQRMQQLIYNIALMKNQKNLTYILVGNGYLANFRELILEMEIPAFLLNFGVIGFILYFIPFLSIWNYGVYIGIKNVKKINESYIMLLIGSGFVFALSFFAGYTFFNSSNMMIIIVLNTLLINEVEQLKKN